ncbi:D-alanine transaminase [Salegentibacter echinorum]|uniref:D-alanine transaminase n=1 Tax=Salegentibacter echinorum TaxID=1073325 RepID=A0A1M5LZS3_SALEC|nr:aminotransferase class IV [Salegentibacter echinorum]SHG70508.1 D-alanine transaminase [Salegentibacter echinorum]
MKPQKYFPDEVYLNGKWLKHDEACVSVFDRAFMLGDGIYEVTPFYYGKAFLLEAHLNRLQTCLNKIQIDFDAFSLKPTVKEAISRAGLGNKDAAVYIQVSRGVAPRTHYYPEKVKTTILLYAFPVTLEGFENKNWDVLVSEDKRWHRCDIKSTALLANVMANEEAVSRGFNENLLIRKGYFTEGSHTSIFFVKYGMVFTHPANNDILEGITRNFVIELCAELDIEVKEKAVHVDELVEIDEIFLTGTTTQIVPVNTITRVEKRVYTAKKDQITRRLQKVFFERTRAK